MTSAIDLQRTGDAVKDAVRLDIGGRTRVEEEFQIVIAPPRLGNMMIGEKRFIIVHEKSRPEYIHSERDTNWRLSRDLICSEQISQNKTRKSGRF